jgi:class 3 adenylate cyclase/CheY-like chemotaxis protein
MGLRTLTILFTDIVGSTELLGGLAGREAVRLRADHFAVLRRQIRRHGGREVKNLGDGLMVAFEAAGEGLDCAVAMQKGSAEEVGRPPRAIPIRIGISSGDVHEQEGDCFGGPVVEASRLCARAEGGQVLVAEATRLMTRGDEELVEVGDLELKGLAQPLRAWEAQWSAEALPRIRVVLADDAVLVREGIAQVLENSGLEVVAQAGNAEELLRLTAELRPDVAIVDVRMPPTHTVEGIEAAEQIRSEHPDTAVLVLSQDIQPRYARRLRAASATSIGYMLKERVTDIREFAEATRRVAAGGTAFEADLTPR